MPARCGRVLTVAFRKGSDVFSMRTNWRRWTKAAAAALFWSTTFECTVFVDHDSKQCRSDSDCEMFGNHPVCRDGVCVSSGLGPADCFYGTPQFQTQFLNQCSTAQCFPFDSCAHNACDDGGVEAGLVSMTPD